MAAMKARRGRGSSSYHDDPPPRSRRRAAPPPPPPRNVSRLALIKMNGGITGGENNISAKSLVVGLSAAVLFTGAAIAGAAWMGNSLFDVREAFNRAADNAFAQAGFGIDNVEVAGVTGARADEVRALIVPDGRQSILSLDPQDVRARIESLDWVDHAQVRRLWPSTVQIHVERRQSYARWQEDGEIAVIDINGERLLAERAADHAELPLVVGAGAGPAAQPLLIALEDLPRVRSRLSALIRVGERRWNLELNSGATVALPEEGAPQALAQLETLDAQHHLLDRPVAQMDLRTPGRLSVRIGAPLAGGPLSLVGGA